MAISLKIRLKISTIQFVDALKRLYPFLSEDRLLPVMQCVALRINGKKVTLFASNNASMKLVHFDNALAEPSEDVTIHISPIAVQEIIEKKNIEEGNYIDLLAYPSQEKKRVYDYYRKQFVENLEGERNTFTKVQLKINRVGEFDFVDTITQNPVDYESLVNKFLQSLQINTFGVLKKDLLAILQKDYYTHYYCAGNKTDVLRYAKKHIGKGTYTFGFLQTLYNNFCQERAATNIILADILLKKVLDSLPKEVESVDIHASNGGKLVYLWFKNQRVGNMYEQVFLAEIVSDISVTKLNEMSPAFSSKEKTAKIKKILSIVEAHVQK